MNYGLGGVDGDTQNQGSNVQHCLLQQVPGEIAGSIPVQARQPSTVLMNPYVNITPEELSSRLWRAAGVIRKLKGNYRAPDAPSNEEWARRVASLGDQFARLARTVGGSQP